MLRFFHLAFVLVFLPVCSVPVDTPAQLFKKASPAVVRVDTSDSVGTGFAIYDGSLVVTCAHVVNGCSTVFVADRPAEILVQDKEKDIAILEIIGKPIESRLKLRKGPAPSPGSKVFVIGNPLGAFEKSITDGIVSSIRKVRSSSLLQITAPVSSGSSGSPVLTQDGLVAGMVRSTIEEGQSLNFAISAYDIKLVFDRILSGANLGMLGQTKRPCKIYSSPSDKSLVYSSVRAKEFVVLRKCTKKGWHKILLRNMRLGYVKTSDVIQLDELVRTDRYSRRDLPSVSD